MNKRKEKNSTAPTLEDTVRRLETRLREFEDRSGKKIKDLENLVEYLTNKVICKLQIFTFTIYRMSAAPLNIDTYIYVYNIWGVRENSLPQEIFILRNLESTIGSLHGSSGPNSSWISAPEGNQLYFPY